MQYNLESILAPSVSDNQYQYENQLTISLICRSDSYKFSHAFAYPERWPRWRRTDRLDRLHERSLPRFLLDHSDLPSRCRRSDHLPRRTEQDPRQGQRRVGDALSGITVTVARRTKPERR